MLDLKVLREEMEHQDYMGCPFDGSDEVYLFSKGAVATVIVNPLTDESAEHMLDLYCCLYCDNLFTLHNFGEVHIF